MANGGFLTKRILLTREDTDGAIQPNPVCIEFLSESFDLKEEQASEEIDLLGTGGDASPMAFGTSSFDGPVGLVISTDNISIVLTHVLGAAITSGDATAVAWGATTAFAKGDIANGVVNAKHTFICVTPGTTGATEPTLQANPNSDRNKRITDGTVVWVVLPKLISDTYERTQQMPTFTVEYELEDAVGTSFYRRFSNVYMNALPIAMTGGTISMKASLDFIASSAIASTDEEWVEPLADIVGAQIVPNFKDFYSYEDCTVKIDGTPLCETEAINLDTSRNVVVDDGVNNCKIINVGTTAISGSINKVFTIADYEAFKAHTDMEVVFDFQKPNGCSFTMTYPLVKPKLADPDQSVDKQAYLNAELSAYGESGVQSVNASIVYPSLVDDAGNLIGAY